MSNIEIDFRYLESGWRTETRHMDEKAVSALLEGATVVNCNFGGWSSSKKLIGITLKLTDGSKCELTEHNEPSWEGSSDGWIYIDVDEEW